jgi:uncharacterized protein (TIGR03437 family)
MHAYDASSLATELFNSNQKSARDALGGYVKFTAPTVTNGKVYAGTPNALVVYGLLGSLSIGNAASGQANFIAPGSLATVYGSGSINIPPARFPIPTNVSGVTMNINNVAAPLLFGSNNQINVQIPFETPPGPATATLMSGGNVVGTVSFLVEPVAPGLFLLGQGRAAVSNQDFSINAPGNPAAAGSVIAAYLTGLGAVDNPVTTGLATPATPLSRAAALVTATIGGFRATVQFAGLAPGFAGLYQVNLEVPQLAPGDYSLVITAGGVAGNPGIVSVR